MNTAPVFRNKSKFEISTNKKQDSSLYGRKDGMDEGPVGEITKGGRSSSRLFTKS